MLKNHQINLLPNQFQKIGYLLTLVTILVFALLIAIDTIQLSSSSTKLLLFGCLVISLGMVIFAREKHEDELVKQVREFSLAIMFFGLLFFSIVDVFWQLILQEQFFHSYAVLALNLEVIYLAAFKGRLSKLSE